MIINGNDAVETEEEVDIPATEELVDGSSTEEIQENNENEVVLEDNPKVFTEVEFNQKLEEKINEILPRRLERKAEKIRKELEQKYSNAENLLKFGFNADSMEEAVEKMQDFYKQKGYEVPTNKKEEINDEDYLRFKAEKEAKSIIDLGYDEIKAETDALSQINPSEMTRQEQLLFSILGDKRIELESKRELELAGIPVTTLEDKDFVEFSKKLNSNLSAKEKVELYKKFNPQKEEYESIGSMKSNSSQAPKYKDFYSPEELRRFSDKDFDDPKLMEIAERSMQEWQKRKPE